MKNILIYCLIFILCGSVEAQNDTPIYSFFTAGHTYGNPNNPHYGLHYPFVDYISTINSQQQIELGFLTGDVVVSSTASYWDSAQIDINTFNIPIYISAGNHDMGPEFLSRFETYYSSFILNDDLFIILTPGLNSWNIEGDQLEFLINTLNDNYNQVNNIFIMMHELIWWSPDNQYSVIDINYEPHYPGATNFEEIVKPLLLSYPNPITLYAGDLGCTNLVSPFMYDHFNNITLIASGMGGGVRDNIIITDIYPDSVHYNLIAINGDDPNALGELTDFTISSTYGSNLNTEINIYPNPCVDFFTIENISQSKMKVCLYNYLGQKVKEQLIAGNSTNIINVTGIERGVYIVLLNGEHLSIKKKIVIK